MPEIGKEMFNVISLISYQLYLVKVLEDQMI